VISLYFDSSLNTLRQFILVDCEHGNIDDGAMHAAVGAIAAEGASPVVRIPGPDNVYVKRALDSGGKTLADCLFINVKFDFFLSCISLAHGILCPSMSTAEEARKLVSFAKFPATTKAVPVPSGWTEAPSRREEQQRGLGISGTRGVGSPFAPAVFRQTLGEYIRTANRNTLIAVQIETLEGLENCEEIARVDGIGAASTLNLTFTAAFAEAALKNQTDMLFIG
jgi:4-hydroxy-2-oxoheptanedioate aldolase